MKKILAALLLVVTFAGFTPRPALALLDTDTCVAYHTYWQGFNGATAGCKVAGPGLPAYRYAQHVRIMLICQNENRRTGWLYGPWKYDKYGSELNCPTQSDIAWAWAYQVY